MSSIYYIESKVRTTPGNQPLYLTFVADDKIVSVSANEHGERQQWLLNDYPASPQTSIIPAMDTTLQTWEKTVGSDDYVATLPKNSDYVWNFQDAGDGYIYIAGYKNTVYWTLASGGHNAAVELKNDATKDDKYLWMIVKTPSKGKNTEYEA